MSVAVLRYSPRDALLVLLAGAYGALVLTMPSAILIAGGVWWIANTVSHNFIHLPFFRDRRLNFAFSAYLSLLIGVPQTLWRDRHLAHHADRAWRLRWSSRFGVELGLVAAAWILMAVFAPRVFLTAWLPGFAGGMTLCWLQGYYEHVRGTISHYGGLYNFVFFNDGYHVEHHAKPAVHWSALPDVARSVNVTAQRSRWPAVLRWLEIVQLNSLERVVLRSSRLQEYVVRRHARALASLIADLPPLKRVAIVGGGLFPRTALVVRQIMPGASISIIDQSSGSIRSARPFLDSSVAWIEASYTPQLCRDADLIVVPLAFNGDREHFYRDPPAATVIIHDWIWNRRGAGRVVAFPLLKRVNLVRR